MLHHNEVRPSANDEGHGIKKVNVGKSGVTNGGGHRTLVAGLGGPVGEPIVARWFRKTGPSWDADQASHPTPSAPKSPRSLRTAGVTRAAA
jgi:hypothetical protein